MTRIIRSAFATIGLAMGVIYLGPIGMTPARAGDDHHGGHGHGGGRGDFHHFSITPFGVGYGFHNKHIDLDIGPVGGGFGYGNGHYHGGCASGHYHSQPYYPPANHYGGSPQFAPSYPANGGPQGGFAMPASGLVEMPMMSAGVVSHSPRIEPVKNGAAVAASSQTLIKVLPESRTFQQRAEQAFRSGNYDEAFRQINHVLVDEPDNGYAHLFASQVMFAQGNFEGAAEAIGAGIQLLPESEWGYVVERFREVYRGEAYVDQMKRLVQYCKENPGAWYARVVRGYHYKYLGHADHAQKQLDRVLTADPNNATARRLSGLPVEEIPAPTPVDGDGDGGDATSQR
jgi:hypothetical protein